MINSVATNGAGLSYSLIVSAASTRSTSTQASGSAQPGWGTPAEVGLGDLTSSDWQLVSAAVGKNVGPDASGNVCEAQPLLAWAIEINRQVGSLASGHQVTVGDLQAMAKGQTDSGYLDQIQNAISYLEEKSETSLSGSSGSLINVAA